jgi:signal transduction histidine kinase/ActR/RegA family two-component response regulator
VTLLHLKEKTFEVFAVSPRLLSPGHSIASVLGRSLPYEEKNRANILSWIDPDKRAYYASITSLEAITKALSEKSPYEINILGHSSANPHEVTCRRLQYSYLDSGKNDVLLIQTDVTTTYLQQEKEAERAKEEAKRVTDILDSVSNGIVVFHMDDETHLEGDFVNLQMFRFLGLPAEKEADRERFMRNPMIQAYLANAFLAVDPSDKARVEASFAKGYHTDRFSVERYKITKQDGSKAYVTTDLILKEKQGARHIYYASYRLVDQEVKLQNEVAHQLQKEKKLRLAADSANRAKSDFLSRMSHDMRTPLNGIIGMSYLAQEEKNPPRTRECLQKIDNSSKFLLGLINDVLDMSKAESGTIELHPEPYGSEAFLQYLDSVIVPLCHEKNIRFVVDAKPLKEEVPLLDTLRINQVFFNLLSNSVKFTPEGGTITYKLREKLNPGEKTMRLSAEVRDTGVGMSEEFLSHLFEPFTQEGRIDNMENRGTGLGLAIVKKMLDLMGCSISVHSAIGLGTSFIVEGDFPFVAAEQKPEPPALTLSGEDFSALKNKHILLAEDHPLNQEIARTLLEEKGMVVAIAEDGKLAYEAFKNSSRGYYDAILMDIRMPVMDGYAATEEIRLLKRPDAKKVPIIALTADAFADDVKKCLAVGMNAHLAKPLEPQKLYATLLREIGPKKK